MPLAGPRQVWTWSRIDGTVQRHRVRPAKFEACWVEECSNGWMMWTEDFLCESPEQALQQARAHFEKIVRDAQAVLARID